MTTALTTPSSSRWRRQAVYGARLSTRSFYEDQRSPEDDVSGVPGDAGHHEREGRPHAASAISGCRRAAEPSADGRAPRTRRSVDLFSPAQTGVMGLATAARHHCRTAPATKCPRRRDDQGYGCLDTFAPVCCGVRVPRLVRTARQPQRHRYRNSGSLAPPSSPSMALGTRCRNTRSATDPRRGGRLLHAHAVAAYPAHARPMPWRPLATGVEEPAQIIAVHPRAGSRARGRPRHVLRPGHGLCPREQPARRRSGRRSGRGVSRRCRARRCWPPPTSSARSVSAASACPLRRPDRRRAGCSGGMKRPGRERRGRPRARPSSARVRAMICESLPRRLPARPPRHRASSAVAHDLRALTKKSATRRDRTRSKSIPASWQAPSAASMAAANDTGRPFTMATMPMVLRRNANGSTSRWDRPQRTGRRRCPACRPWPRSVPRPDVETRRRRSAAVMSAMARATWSPRRRRQAWCRAHDAPHAG